MLLDGRIALVTGGASGIGLATARRLAAGGATVIVADLAEEAGEAAAGGLGGGAWFTRLDVGEPAEWSAVVAAALERHGGIDVAHLNAGTTSGAPLLEDLDDAAYRRIMRANVDGVVLGTRAVLPAMRARGGGAIVATASMAGLIAFAPDPVYCATKHAVVGFVRAAAPQLQSIGITINAVCPSIVDTPLLGEETKATLAAAGFPMIDPDEVAAAVLGCVAGEETGQAIVVQVAIEPTPYRFAGVPGPGGEFRGVTPPPQAPGGDIGR